MKEFIIVISTLILVSNSSYTQDYQGRTYKDSINKILQVAISRRSQLDTSTSLAGERWFYKKLGFIKIRIAKGVGRDELVYCKDNLIYYLDISEYNKGKKHVSQLSYYYYIDNQFVKFEDTKTKANRITDSLYVIEKDILYLDKGKIVKEELKNINQRSSSKDLESLNKIALYQLEQFRLVRKYDNEQHSPAANSVYNQLLGSKLRKEFLCFALVYLDTESLWQRK
jgi:hypothetical protein